MPEVTVSEIITKLAEDKAKLLIQVSEIERNIGNLERLANLVKKPDESPSPVIKTRTLHGKTVIDVASVFKTKSAPDHLKSSMLNKEMMKDIQLTLANCVIKALEVCGPLTPRHLATAIANLGYRGRDGKVDRDRIIKALHNFKCYDDRVRSFDRNGEVYYGLRK